MVRPLILAINCYISTGDRIGEGLVLTEGEERLQVVIPVDPANPDDLRDFHRFERRISELSLALDLRLNEQEGAGGKFRFYLLSLYRRDLHMLAKHLAVSCGGSRWGSGRALIEANPQLSQEIETIAEKGYL